MSQNIYSFSVPQIDGTLKDFSELKGKVLLVVNVASRCGFTPQYEGLEQLYEKYKGDGFLVLGFPCNQFANQEPASEEEIKSFCSLTYNISFPLFKKIEVNGKNTHPLYQLLKKEKPGFLGSRAIKWNFTKFLIARDGRILKRFSPKTEPDEIEGEIVAALRQDVSF